MRYLEIFWVFLKLGCTSFGGPIAHLVYFRKAFVEEKAWLSEAEYANILTLCQSLPGPASSQVGFTIGLRRAGLFGALAAFIAFTLPSIVLLLLFAHSLFMFESQFGKASLEGLMILAFAVVLHGVLGMGKKLCAANTHFFIALCTFIIVLLFDGIFVQVLTIFMGGLFSLFLPRLLDSNDTSFKLTIENSTTNYYFPIIMVLLLFSLFFILPLFSSIANDFYRSGALVFGGGHVVLPLLEEVTVGQGAISQDDFLAGYGATQALPGPMFSFAAYLGFMHASEGGIQGALVASIFIFLPGFLLVYALHPIWHQLSQNPTFQGFISGSNAAVVGLLAAALYNPIFVHAINSIQDVVIAAIAFALLSRCNISVLWVVLCCVALKCVFVMVPF